MISADTKAVLLADAVMFLLEAHDCWGSEVRSYVLASQGVAPQLSQAIGESI